ncbi:MAG: hypothetical protein O2973_08705 [Gemmatimonadetes bacterium]|nr:hypothetical protein [Gemmatimonadota bacterium]
MRPTLKPLCIALALTMTAAAPLSAPLSAQESAPMKLLGPPGLLPGKCTVVRSSIGNNPRDSTITRTLLLSESGKDVRRIVTAEDLAGQLVRVSDVSFTALENVEVRFAGNRPRVSWHTTGDTGMPDSAAGVAAQRLADVLRRRCSVR